MLKKIFILLAAAVIVSQFFAWPALASVKLYARTVNNISGSYDPETNSITLKWDTIVTSQHDLNTDTITILKGTSDYDLQEVGKVNVNNSVKVDEIPPGEIYDKTHEITFTDKNVELDKEYKYVVSCGSISQKWQEIYVAIRSQLDEKSGEVTDRREEYEQSADWPERLGGSILLAIPNYLVRVIGLDDPLELIYQVEVDDPGFEFSRPQIVIEDKGGSGNDVYLHTFTKNEFGALSQFYDRLNELVPVSLVMVIVLLGAVLLFVTINPNARLTAKDYIIGILIGLAVLKFGIYLIAMIFDLNYMLVKFFHWIVGDQLSASFLDTLIDLKSNTLGSAIVTFLAIFSIGIINWQYTLRKVVLALLIGLIPIVAVISIAPSRRSAIEYWLREFIAQVFLQSSHAAALTLIILFIHANTGFWVSLVGIMSLPAIASIVRRVAGAESFGTGIASGIGTALGLGSLFSISKMLKPNGRVAKLPLDAGGETMGVSTATSGGFMGNMVKTGFSTAVGLTAGVAGGLITGAATGNPGFGLISGMAVGTAVGGGIANTAHSVIDNFKKSPAERMESLGIIDPAQLDDPQKAFEYGKKMFGGGTIGTVAGLGMAAGKKVQSFMGHADPSIARQVKSSIDLNTANLSRARQELENYKPVYDEARARLLYAKNMFSPDSSYMKDLKQQARSLDTKLNEAEQKYADFYDDWQNNWEDKITSPSSMTPTAIAALQRVQQAQDESAGLRIQLQETQERIALAKQEYQEAQANFQSIEAQYAQKQEAVSYFQQNLTQAGIKQEFEKLKSQKQETYGGIDLSWR